MNKDQQFPYVDLSSIITACLKNVTFIILLTCIGALAGFLFYRFHDVHAVQYGYSVSYSVVPDTDNPDAANIKDVVETSTLLGRSYMQIFTEASVQGDIISRADATDHNVVITSGATQSDLIYAISVTADSKEAVIDVIDEVVRELENGSYGQFPGSRVILADSAYDIREENVYEMQETASWAKPVLICTGVFFVLSIVFLCFRVMKNGYITRPQVLSEITQIPLIGYAEVEVRRKTKELKK